MALKSVERLCCDTRFPAVRPVATLRNLPLAANRPVGDSHVTNPPYDSLLRTKESLPIAFEAAMSAMLWSSSQCAMQQQNQQRPMLPLSKTAMSLTSAAIVVHLSPDVTSSFPCRDCCVTPARSVWSDRSSVPNHARLLLQAMGARPGPWLRLNAGAA
jgi:hypothetical protein